MWSLKTEKKWNLRRPVQNFLCNSPVWCIFNIFWKFVTFSGTPIAPKKKIREPIFLKIKSSEKQNFRKIKKKTQFRRVAQKRDNFAPGATTYITLFCATNHTFFDSPCIYIYVYIYAIYSLQNSWTKLAEFFWGNTWVI